MPVRANIETDLRSAVATRLGEAKFGLWFGEGVRLGVDGDNLVVGVPNGFFREWIASHYAASLVEAAAAVTGRPLRLDLQIDAEAEPPLGDVVEPSSADRRVKGPTVPIPSGPPAAPNQAEAPRNQRRIAVPRPLLAEVAAEQPRPVAAAAAARPMRRLEDFVTGTGNRLAHAATVEMVQTGAAAFNPLIIHGGVGLGKTHLLEGAAAGLRARMPGANVVAVSAEGFTNGFLEAMRTGGLAGFRNRYRKADALIVDDVHFLAAKRATQDEFLHTFNALASAGAPIVLAADQHPRRISRLTEELVTRFLGGMVVKIEPPGPATRRAILRSKAAARGVDVPDAVLAYIADHIRASVRELEGALNSLIAQAVLTGKRLDMSLAQAALRDTIRHTAQAVALKDVERAVCELFQLDAEALRSDSRARAVTHPRMLAMYLARKHTGASYSEIGRHFGGRNHSTVISAEKKVASWLKEEQRSGLLAGFERVSDLLTALEQGLGAA